MKVRALLAVSIVILLPSVSVAQDIYGRVWLAGKGKSAVNAKVIVACAGNSPPPVRTDRNGVYRLRGLRAQGQCTITVQYGGKDSNAVTVFVSGARTRANLELRELKGRWAVIRK